MARPSDILETELWDPESSTRAPIGSTRRFTKGEFVLRLLEAFGAAGLSHVYLRNYDDVPCSVGHDVDLLVARGSRDQAAALVRSTARDLQWMYLGSVEFSPIAMFVASPDGAEILHIDLFDRIEWHWCEFADATRILSRRVHSGVVYRPSLVDEVCINLCTRWIYTGIVRQKHREQLATAVAEEGEAEIREAFVGHWGRRYGSRIAGIVLANEWHRVARSVWTLRTGALIHYGFKRPASLVRGTARYIRRTFARLISYPGPFVVILGADGVGKSSAINGMVALLEEITGVSVPLFFHWKPCKASLRTSGSTPSAAQNPRGKKTRGRVASLAFLAYHWIGFWIGWLRWIYPQLVRSRPVVGDRYSDDMFLDPARFRLRLPDWLVLLASRTVPRPSIILGLVADPLTIYARKPELGVDEIADYQERLAGLCPSGGNVVLIDANGTAEDVQARIRIAILRWAEKKAAKCHHDR